MIKKISRLLFYSLSIALLIIALTALAIRFIVFPNIDQYKDDIAQYASKILGQKVSIGEIITGWDGISPHIALKKIDVFDAENRVALHLNHVEANVSWLSIPMLQPRLSNLIIHKPALTIRRKPDGNVFLAGINIGGKSNPAFSNWLLRQRQVRIINAELNWFDELRNAPVLSLNQLNLNLNNPVINSPFGQHQFVFSANPSIGTRHAVKVSGLFVGGDISKSQNWHGNVSAQLKNTDISVWKPWFDYPIDIQSGLGDALIDLEFANQKIEQIKIVTDLKNLSVKVETQDKVQAQDKAKDKTQAQAKALLANEFSGEINWSDFKNTQNLSVKQLKLAMPAGLNISNGSGSYVTSVKNNKPWVSAQINLDQFDLSLIKQLSIYAKLPQKLMSAINGLSPTGQLNKLKLSFYGAQSNPDNYAIQTDFSQLSLRAFEKIPGVSNLSGVLVATDTNGKLTLQSKKVMLEFKDILRWPIPADQLTGSVNWTRINGNLNVDANQIFITSPHVTGTINAKYSAKDDTRNKTKNSVRDNAQAVNNAYLDLTGKFSRGDAQYALFYYPTILNKLTLDWLDTSILKGDLKDIDVKIKGKLADFPFVNKNNQADNKLGIFKVSAQLTNGLLDYGTGWPAIDGLNSSLLFVGTSMELNATAGNMLGNKIAKTKAVIRQLDTDKPLLTITGEIQGSVEDGIKYVNSSPVKSVTQGFTDELLASGKGNLLLTLNIPLQNVDAAKFTGAYKVTNAMIYGNAQTGLPELTNLNGTLNFTESSLNAQNISAEVFGSPAKFSLKTQANKAIQIVANGQISDAALKKISPNILSNNLKGSTTWAGEINIKPPLVDVNLSSNLTGMAINLPAPFNKSANQTMALNLVRKQSDVGNESLSISLASVLDANINRKELAGEYVIERGDIGINMPAVTPKTPGLALHGKFDALNADEWLSLFNQPGLESATNKSQPNPLFINKADVIIQKLTIFGRSINALKLSALPNINGFKMAVNSLEMTGDVQWQSKQEDVSSGKIIARLKNLSVPKAIIAEADANAKTGSKKPDFRKPDFRKPDFRKPDFRKQAQEYPALDIVAENFEVNGKKLGALNLNAFENGEDWVIQKLNITNDDSTLNVQGNWHNWTRNPNTNLVVALSSSNIGRTFKRFGQPDVLKGGVADVNGQLNWAGSPHEFDTSQLNGNLTFLATKGQILKVKPGVGRLFGLLTLQSLPRRLSLDFRDLFNDGFAYDTISATAKIDNGILRSDNFIMDGPAAEAIIKGETNLKTEMVDLKVKVRPHISDTLSLAALAGGPIVGAAAFVAQKLLKDPFNKIVGSEYSIAGTWDKPVEVKSDTDKAKSFGNDSPLTP